MIELTTVYGRKIIVNAEEIEIIESSHETTISLKSGKKVIVKEPPDEIIQKVIKYKQECFGDFLSHLKSKPD